MTKTTITIRIDSKLKADLETACNDDGRTLTDVIHTELRGYLDAYYKRKANQARGVRGQIAIHAHDLLLAYVEMKRADGHRIQIKPQVLEALLELSDE